MTAKRTRANGEGSIFPYKNGHAAYVWVNKPDGTRTRKYVYGKTREDVHAKWIDSTRRRRTDRSRTRPALSRRTSTTGYVRSSDRTSRR